MNNHMTVILEEMQKGADALTALERAASRFPQDFPQQKIALAQSILSGNKGIDLQTIVQNMARERGITVENVLRSMGVTIPSRR